MLLPALVDPGGLNVTQINQEKDGPRIRARGQHCRASTKLSNTKYPKITPITHTLNGSLFLLHLLI